MSVYEQKKVVGCSGLNQVLSVLLWREQRLINTAQVTPLPTYPLKRTAA